MTEKSRKKKGGITIKVPIEELRDKPVIEEVKGHLESNPKFAFTISGLLVELYGYKAEELNAPFKDWPAGAPSQYTRVRLALEKLKKEGAISGKKQGKKVLYWCQNAA